MKIYHKITKLIFLFFLFVDVRSSRTIHRGSTYTTVGWQRYTRINYQNPHHNRLITINFLCRHQYSSPGKPIPTPPATNTPWQIRDPILRNTWTLTNLGNAYTRVSNIFFKPTGYKKGRRVEVPFLVSSMNIRGLYLLTLKENFR